MSYIRYTTAVCMAVYALLIAWCVMPMPAYAATRPNVVVIISDDMGYGDTTPYGGKIATPNLEQLARGGIKLTDFHAGPVCTPTRDELVTGRYSQRNGLNFPLGITSTIGLRPADVTVMELLKGAGYRTGYVGKWHLGYRHDLPGNQDPFTPNRHGVDFAFGPHAGELNYYTHIANDGKLDWWRNGEPVIEPNAYSGTRFTQEAIGFIDRNQGRPFFLTVAFQQPHAPFQAPGGTAAAQANNPSNYPAMVRSLDDEIGQILSHIEQIGLAQDTIVFFFNDNGGYSPGTNFPLRGIKGGMFEGGHRTPAIISWPGKIAPRVSPAFVVVEDLYPTIAALAGVPLPTGYRIDGTNITRFLLNNESVPQRPWFWGYNGNYAVRNGAWKLVVLGNQPPMLFDLSKDIGEKNNVAAAKPAIVASLRTMLDAWKRDVATNRTK